MNLPRLPNEQDALFVGLHLRAWVTRAYTTAPALARAFLRGLCGG